MLTKNVSAAKGTYSRTLLAVCAMSLCGAQPSRTGPNSLNSFVKEFWPTKPIRSVSSSRRGVRVCASHQLITVSACKNSNQSLRAAERKLLKKHGVAPATIVTDKLGSYRSALRELGIARRHDTGRWKNNRAENSDQPLRQRERRMKRFKSPGSAHRFLSFTPPSTMCSTSSAI